VSTSSAIAQFISTVPKVELHLHLVGSASPTTVARLAAGHQSASVPADPDDLVTFFEFTDFAHFIEVYRAVNNLVTDGADIADLIDGAADDLARQHVRYVEMTVTPYSHVAGAGIAYGDVLEGLAEGRRRARARGVEFAWVYDIPGEMGLEAAAYTAHVAVEDPPEGLVAFGLGGIEAGVDRAGFIDAFERARSAGLRSVPHAGEADGPSSIWAAIRFLDADRIGHGVRSIEHRRLVDHLVEHRIPLEVCPSSNVCTRVYPSLGEHPIRRLIDAGVIVTINTDDPAMFNTTLNDEYHRVADTFQLGLNDVAELVRNGVRSSFLDEHSQQSLLADIDATVEACHP
jgi:aminodeoxyfutalosine deaminase